MIFLLLTLVTLECFVVQPKYIPFQTLLVKNKQSFENLPPVLGMLSYREDNKKLYVNKGNEWDAIGSEKEVNFDGCLFKLNLKIVLSSGWSDK